MIYNNDQVIAEIKETGYKRAKSKALLVAAIESRKIVLAEKMNDIETDNFITNPKVKASEAKLGRLARATKEYKEHIDKIEKYSEQYLQDESDYDAVLANKSFLRDMNSENTAKIHQGIYSQGS